MANHPKPKLGDLLVPAGQARGVSPDELVTPAPVPDQPTQPPMTDQPSLPTAPAEEPRPVATILSAHQPADLTEMIGMATNPPAEVLVSMYAKIPKDIDRILGWLKFEYGLEKQEVVAKLLRQALDAWNPNWHDLIRR